MGNITTIIDAGYDAFTNLYDIDITLPTKVSEPAFENISIRVADFQPKEGNAQPYTTHYKINEVDRQKPLLELDRTLSFTIRLDSEYKILQALKKWKNIFFSGDGEGSWIADMYNGVLTDDNYGKIRARAYSSDVSGDSFIPKKIWTYNWVVCSKIGTPQFTREASNPSTVTAEFMFLTYTLTND